MGQVKKFTGKKVELQEVNNRLVIKQVDQFIN